MKNILSQSWSRLRRMASPSSQQVASSPNIEQSSLDQRPGAPPADITAVDTSTSTVSCWTKPRSVVDLRKPTEVALFPQAKKPHPLLAEVRDIIKDINVDQPTTPLVNKLMCGYWVDGEKRAAVLWNALRVCAADRQVAEQFQADVRVWKALTALSRSIWPATELNHAFIEKSGSAVKWLAVHANVERGGFTIYEKVNDCDAEAGYERCLTTHDTFESAVSDVSDRALLAPAGLASLHEETPATETCGLR